MMRRGTFLKLAVSSTVNYLGSEKWYFGEKRAGFHDSEKEML